MTTVTRAPVAPKRLACAGVPLAVLAAAAATAAHAQDLTVRPGRWETSAVIGPPGEAAQPGSPLAEPLVLAQCVTEEEAASFRGLDDLLPVEDCTMSRQDASDGAIRLAAVCVEDGERYEIDILLTSHSSEHWSGEARSRTSDPALGELHITFESRRTGDACTPEELAADDEDDL